MFVLETKVRYMVDAPSAESARRGVVMFDEAASVEISRVYDAIEFVACCRLCGCTDDEACDEGCSWVEPDLCSSCATRQLLAAAS